nr:type II toxin-antitoxin system RelE/ParE family toxin [Halovivax ruber]
MARRDWLRTRDPNETAHLDRPPARKLSGYPYYKLRAGDYRAISTWDRTDDVLIVEVVGHRRNIYDCNLPP